MSWWITDDWEEFNRRRRERQDAMSKSWIGKKMSDRKNEGTLGHPWQTRRAVEPSPDDEEG